MKVRNRFEEMKINLVMKLRGLDREAAIKALHLDKSPKGADAVATKHENACMEHLMTVEGFFGGQGDDDLMPAEEFFKD